MGRYDTELPLIAQLAERQLTRTENPHHRAILKNYRRHALLELSGRYEEILTPEMTVEHPVYRMHEGGISTVFDGMDEVRAFYASWAGADSSIMWVTEQDWAVADWGLSGEVVANQFMPSALLEANSLGKEFDPAHDPGPIVILRRTLGVTWRYDSAARLIGEHVYEDAASREAIECDPADVITAARAAELLEPELDRQVG